MSRNITREEVNKVWDEFWKPILFKNGKLDIEQVKSELFDYHIAMQEVSKVYMEISNGKFSKPNTDSIFILSEFEQRIQESIQDYMEENK